MLDKVKLCEFLVKAKRATYAAGDAAQKVLESDKSTTLIFEEGDFRYHDNYFGGEPFGGREVVFFEERPVYIMVYYGKVDESIQDPKEIYQILMTALKMIPVEKPFRGPAQYEENDLIYKNSFVGDIENFSGEEVISQNGEEVYRAKYAGGLVDQK